MNEFKVVYSISSWLPVTMTWVYTQIKYLNNFSPIILADSVDGLDRLPNYNAFAIPGSIRRLLLHNLRRIGIRVTPNIYSDVLEKFHPVVLHSHFGDRGWYDLPMAQKYRLRQLVTFYGYDLSLLPAKRPIWKRRYKELFEQSILLLVEGEYMANTLEELGCPREKIRVQQLGVDIDGIPFKHRNLGEDGKVRILIAGRFLEKKGIPDAIQAVSILRNQYPDIEVTIIGDSSGTPREEQEKDKIYEAVRLNKLENVVKLLGFQPFQVLLEQAYQHQIFLSPSVISSDGDSEGGVPVSIIEMMASGMIVVSTDHCDIPGVVQNGVNGLLAEEHQPEQLAYHMKWLIDHPQKWLTMAEAGRNHVEQKYNAQVQGTKLASIYEDLFR